MINKTSRYYIDIIQERSWVWFGKLQTKYIVNEEVTTEEWVGSTYMPHRESQGELNDCTVKVYSTHTKKH